MPWRVKTRNAMEEESKVALTRSSGNNRSEKYNFFQSQGFSFKKWEVRPFIFQGKSTEALRGHRCSRLIRVSFFRKSEFVVWKSEFIFLKIGVWFLEIGVCLFWKSEFVLFKIGVCFLKIRVLAPDSVLSFCSGVRTKSVADPWKGPGSPAPLYL